MLVFASLGLLVGLSRQVSLCHAVFVVFGATTLSHLRRRGPLPAGAACSPGSSSSRSGALVAIPAIRLSGLFLALATFGFGVLAQDLLFNTKFVFGTEAFGRIDGPSCSASPSPATRPSTTSCWPWSIAGVLVIELVRVTRLGRILRALADSPTATESVGVNPTAPGCIVFCLSAFLAAVAGGLLGTLTQVGNTTSFDFSQSLLWITVLVTAGPPPSAAPCSPPSSWSPSRPSSPRRPCPNGSRSPSASWPSSWPRPRTASLVSSGCPTSPPWPAPAAWRRRPSGAGWGSGWPPGQPKMRLDGGDELMPTLLDVYGCTPATAATKSSTE